MSHIEHTARNTRSVIALSILGLLLIPLVASASWWNPISWFGGWFGLFDRYAKEEVITIDENPEVDEGPVVMFPTQGGGTFTRATSSGGVTAPSPTPPTSPTTTTPPSAPRPSTTVPPPAPRPPTPPPPTSGTVTTPPKTNGVVTFSKDVQIARRTIGIATSSNDMRIWLLSTSTRMTIKQTAVTGITFKVGTCKAFPCTIPNIVSVASTVKEGAYRVTVTVTSGTTTAIGTYTVTVKPPEPLEIQMTVSGPITVKKNVNGTVAGSNIVYVQVLRGTPEKLTLTQSDFPDGVTGKTTLSTCTPPCKITNTVSVSYASESGRHPMVITATGNTIAQKSVGYDLNIGYASGFGMHFDGEKRTYTQNQNPTALIVMDYPFDLLLDGGTSEVATFIDKQSNASTSVTYSRTTCTLPCMGMNARIQMLQGMKPGTYTVKLQAVVEREESDGRGGTKIVKYTETWSLPVKIVALALPY